MYPARVAPLRACRPFVRSAVAAGSVAALVGGILMLGGSASAAGAAYQIHRASPYGGEPSLTVDGNGVLYESALVSAGAMTYRSSDGGQTWTAGKHVAYSSTGDDCLATDQSNAVYLCNLTILGPSDAPLQGDVYKSTDQGDDWVHGQGVAQTTTGEDVCGTSCIPIGVDRDWLDAYIPPGKDTNTAEVVLMYHDFGTTSHIYVNMSNDGGKTFGPPINVLANAVTTHPGAQAALALADQACSTVPAAVKIVKSGPHAGRIYLAWIAADPTSVATGCNATQAQAFHNLFVAWSDDNGATWNPQLAYDAGLFHDTSTPFVGFTLDNAGNPYFGFAANNTAYQPQNCAVPQNPQTPDCEYDMYVVWSPDGGATWNDGGGTVPGSASKAYKVNSDSDHGTHWFPAIAAYNPGQVAVAYLHTDDIIPTDANGKQHPGGCFSTSGTCKSKDTWNLFTAQSSDLLGADGKAAASPTWTVTQVTQQPMHQGDICNLGIACPPSANRHLADFISTVIDPAGCQHVVYADDKTTNEVDSADQTAGCFAANVGADLPESRWAPLLVGGGTMALLAVAATRRRRRAIS